MSSALTTRVTRPPARFLSQLQALESPFTTDQVQERLPKLRPSSISVYLSHAAKAGLIEQVGTKTFVHARPKEAPSRLPMFAHQTIDRMRGRILPVGLAQLTIWSSDNISAFTEDSIPDPFLVIEGPRDVLRTIRGILDEEDVPVVEARSRSELARRAWHPDRGRARIFLVHSKQLDATRPSGMGFQVPTISRLLVTALEVPSLVPRAALEIMAHPEFDLDEAIRAAPSKKSAALLGAFFARVRDEHPAHPAVRQINRFLHHSREGW